MRKIRRSLLGSTSFQVALICNWLNDQGIRLMPAVTGFPNIVKMDVKSNWVMW